MPTRLTTTRTVLVVDDELYVRRSTARLLERKGYRVIEAESGEDALAALRKEPVQVALIDYELPDMNGAALLRHIRDRHRATHTVMITGKGDSSVAFQALQRGCDDYFDKPIQDHDRLFKVLDRLCTLTEKDEELENLRVRLEHFQRDQPVGAEMIGRSPAMVSLNADVSKVARLPINVLITGESGSGKEHVARALHTRSDNAEGPFVAINCAGLQPNLLEAQLFGSTKGAFTGALTSRVGLCAAAEGGTLFLDEVGEIPFELQAKLLRVLQNREFRPVGAVRNQELKARVVSATNVDLEQASAEGRFREDLYYRLNDFVIRVPPLRDRDGDIPLLTWYFIDRYNTEYGRDVRRVHPDALALLSGRTWEKNNVRELQRAVQQALVLAEEDQEELGVKAFSPRASPADPARAALIDPAWLSMHYRDAKDALIGAFSRQYLENALDRNGRSVTQAALFAGVARPNFSKLMKKYGVTAKRDE